MTILTIFFLFFSLDNNHDDEFVSDSYQASSADIDEVNASMKTLGVKGTIFFLKLVSRKKNF